MNKISTVQLRQKHEKTARVENPNHLSSTYFLRYTRYRRRETFRLMDELDLDSLLGRSRVKTHRRNGSKNAVATMLPETRPVAGLKVLDFKHFCGRQFNINLSFPDSFWLLCFLFRQFWHPQGRMGCQEIGRESKGARLRTKKKELH